ncbi:MAG: hypothetical protein IID33_10765 [Planctomycetes bacterium]|nr:hypothetical protein [Planctomycetota bacterium]
MAEPRQRPLGRMALLLVLVVLAMTSALAAYAMSVKLRNLPIVSPPPEAGGPDPTQRLKLLLALVLAAVLAILAFVVGAYLFIRLGRSLMEKPVSDGPTEFVDVWSQYRVSQEEIDAVDAVPDYDGEDDELPPPTDDGDGTDQDDDDSQDER